MASPQKRRISEVKPLASPLDWTEGLQEACWLGAVIVIPLLCNPHSVAAYNFNKILFLRSLAFLTLLSWLARPFTHGFSWSQTKERLVAWARQPFFWILAALAISQGLSTLFSVRPFISWWGSIEFMQGSMTLGSLLILFGSISLHLCRREQVERLVTAILLTSLAASLFAVMERLGGSPIAAAADYEGRTGSTTGNPIFFSGYLLLVIPLALWRVWSLYKKPDSPGTPFLLWIYSFVAVVDFGGFVLANSRGPFLGLLAALIFMFAGVCILERRLRALTFLGACGALLLAGVIWLNCSPLPFTDGPRNLWQRFGDAVIVQHLQQDSRLIFWKEAPGIIGSPEPLLFPAGGTDSFHLLRPWIGYGPETQAQVFPHFFTFPNPLASQETRFHNFVWDTLYTTGLLGLAAFISFFTALFYGTAKQLGRVPTSATRWFLSRVLLTLTCTLAFSLGMGPAWIGLGVTLGLALSLALTPFESSLSKKISHSRPQDTQILQLALLAAWLGYWIENGFAFPTAVTSVYFWVLSGLGVALLRHPSLLLEEKASPSSLKLAPETFFPVLVLVTLLFGVVHQYFFQPLDPGEILWMSLTQAKGHPLPSHFIGIVLFPFLTVSFLILSKRGEKPPATSRRLVYLGGAIGAVLASGALWACLLSWIGPIPRMASLLEVSQTQGQGHEILVVLIHSLLIALVLGFGRVLSPSIQTAKIQPLLSLKILCLGAGLFGLFFWFHTLNPVRADAELAWAQALETFHRNHFSLDAYRRASELAPSSEPNRRVLADALTRWAINHPEDPRGPELLEEASETLRKAIEDSRGLGRSSFDLGKLSLLQALQTSRPESKKLKSQEASLFLDQACLQEPGSSEIWFDRALVDLLLLDNPKEAEIKIQQADLLIQHPFLLAWADQYWIKTQTASHPMLKQQYGQRTLNLYHHIFLASPHNPELQSACRVGEGSVALELGDPTAALSLLLDSIQLFPQKTSWTTLAKLMEIYLLKGDTATAHSYLLQALRVAPEEKRDALRQLLPEGDPEAKPPQS